MHLPCVSMHIDDGGNLVVTHQKEGRDIPFSVPIPLQELDRDGFDLASRKLGSLALRLLQMWYPAEMQDFTRLKPPSSS